MSVEEQKRAELKLKYKKKKKKKAICTIPRVDVENN